MPEDIWLFKVFRFLYRLLYNQLAWTYDWVSWIVSAGQWRDWQKAGLPFLRGRRVLEIAHGPGHMLVQLAHSGFAVTGLDLSPAMGRQARRRVRAHGLAVLVCRSLAQALPFAAEAFDSLLLTFPAEFVFDPVAVAEFSRVLQPGGRVVIVMSANVFWARWLDRLVLGLLKVTHNPAAALTDWPARFLARYNQAGLSGRVERVRLARSEALLVIAQKEPGPG